jgi:hypothetical protein
MVAAYPVESQLPVATWFQGKLRKQEFHVAQASYRRPSVVDLDQFRSAVVA